MSSEHVAVERSPRLLAALPVLYIVWADGMLSQHELDEIRSIYLSENSHLTADERIALTSWLDANNPPSAATLAEWLTIIERHAGNADERSRSSLAAFGSAIVAQTGLTLSDEDPTRQAIQQVSDLLGLTGSEPVLRLGRSATKAQQLASHEDIDTEKLTTFLYPDKTGVRSRVLSVVSDKTFTAPPQEIDAFRDWVRDRVVDLADAGFGSIGYPKYAGGQDDMRGFITAFETIALADLSVVIKYGVQFGLFGGSIHQLGTEKQHRSLLPSIGSAATLGCFAMSELGHGSNVRDIKTTATYDHATRELIINTPSEDARKEWIGNAARHGELATVFAQLRVAGTNYGVHAVTVPIRDQSGAAMPGIRLEDCGHKMGLNGIDNGRIWFDNVRVPVESLLDRFASIADDGVYLSPIPSDGKRFFTMLGTLVGGRISVGCAGLSATKTALTIAIRYSSRRRQFGPKGSSEVPLLTYLTQQRRLLPRLAVAYGLHFALHDLADRYTSIERSESVQEIEVLASALKSVGTWHTTDTIQACREACGGQGYLSVNQFDRLKADTDVFTTFEGDNTVLMLQVAKGMLSSYKQQFSDMNWLMMARHIAEMAGVSLRDRNPLVARQTSSEHLRSTDFQQAALEYREKSLLRSLAKRLKARMDDGMDSFDAVVECQDHMVSTARALAERVILEQFVVAIANAPEAIRTPLELLRQLAGLHFIEQDRAWFLEQGFIEENKAKAVRAEVNRLCGEVQPYAVSLVDGFGIPEVLVRAPIAEAG